MKKLPLLLSVLVALAVVQTASAQFAYVAAVVRNANYEQGVFGSVANTSGCSMTPLGSLSPSWASPSMPVTLGAVQAVTWGYPDGTTGSTVLGGQSTSGYQLTNVSFRNVIRGGNNNSGTASGFTIETQVTGVSSFRVKIWGPTLNSYGVTGATHFTWTLVNLRTGGTISSSGELSFTYAGASPSDTDVYQVTVTASDPNELGSVLVTFEY